MRRRVCGAKLVGAVLREKLGGPRVDRPGTHTVHADPVARVLHGRCARQVDHARLGSVVRRHADVASEPGDRRRVDDRAASEAAQQRHRELDAEERARQAHVEHAAPAVDRDVFETRGLGEPRVVEHDVEAAIRLDGEIERRLHAVHTRGIHLDADRTTTGSADSVGYRGGTAAADVSDDNAGAFARESRGRRGADARAASGHDHHLRFEASGASPVAHRRHYAYNRVR